jgi:outer membrane protein TolC
MRPRNRDRVLRLGAAALLASLAGCRSDDPWSEERFEKLVSESSATPWTQRDAASAAPTRSAADGADAAKSDLPVRAPSELPSLIQFSLENNPSTRAEWHKAQSRAAQLGMIESLYLPTLSATGFGGYVQQVAYVSSGEFINTGPQVSASLQLAWILADFGRRDAQTDAARRALLASNYSFNRALQKVIFEVQDAYFRLDAKLALQQTAEQNLETARTQLEAVEDRMIAGLCTRPDLLLARQQFTQAQFALEAAASAAFDARSTLARRVGLPAETELAIASLQRIPLPAELTDQVDQLIRASIRNRPDLLAAVERVRSADADIKLAEAQFLPIVNVGGFVGQTRFWYTGQAPPGGAGTQNQSLWGPEYAIGLNGSWLLFDGFERSNAVRKARADRAAASAELEKLRLEASSEVWSSYFDHRASVKQFAFGESLLKASQDAYDAVFEAYVNGLRTINDLLVAESDLFAARSTLIRTRADLLTSAAKLAYAVGAPEDTARWARRADAAAKPDPRQ